MTTMVTWRWYATKQSTVETDRAESERLRQDMLSKSAKLDEWVVSLRMELARSERPSDDQPPEGQRGTTHPLSRQ